ncbi:hypothetical protein ASG58_21320 [Rhizobium sp. Leaf383]|nr:hypothetical protein ASG58_21320 [Rhizobium sp. Leaf383]
MNDLENSGLSVAEIAAKYKRSVVTIRKLYQRSGVVRLNKPKTKGPTKRDNRLPISREHHAIGIRLNMARAGRGVKEFADTLGVSHVALAQMEVGQYDFRLSHLMAIAKATNLPIDALMQSFESNLYKNGRTNARH